MGKSKYNIFLILTSLSLAIISFNLAFSKSSRSIFIKFIKPPLKRSLLASMSLKLSENMETYEVLKIKNGDDIVLEIFDTKPEQNKVAFFNLDSKHNAEVFLTSKNTPLAAKDLDGDQILDIIVPVFSKKNLSPKIFVIKYNPLTNSFYKADSISLIQNL